MLHVQRVVELVQGFKSADLFNIDVIQFGLQPELEKEFSPFTIH